MTQEIETIEGDARWRGAFLLIASCFLLSGFAALLYETVWLRQFAIILGTSEQALAVILASYMGGLSAGAWVASKQIARVRHPVWLYGVLEAGIALCAIAMPWGLNGVEYLQTQLFGGSAEHTLDALCDRLDITIPAEVRHTALGDAVATAKAFVAMLPILESKGLTTLGAVLEECRKHQRILESA